MSKFRIKEVTYKNANKKFFVEKELVIVEAIGDKILNHKWRGVGNLNGHTTKALAEQEISSLKLFNNPKVRAVETKYHTVS